MLRIDGVDLTDIVDAKEACRILGGSRPIDHSTLYRGIAAGKFPPPVKLGRLSSRWIRAELVAAIRKLAAERRGGADASAA
jgi:predicted DNA-binding transcriptional regulator AlpA